MARRLQCQKTRSEQQFGLFIVADGAEHNPGFVFDGSGRLEFINTVTGGPANIADDAAEIALRHVADDGSVRTVQGAVFHTADVDPDPLQNDLNPGGTERVVSGVDAFKAQRSTFDLELTTTDDGRTLAAPANGRPGRVLGAAGVRPRDGCSASLRKY
jgi:hypothetical protein